MIVQGMITFVWLVLLSLEDICMKKVHRILLLFGVMIAGVVCVYNAEGGRQMLLSVVKATIPGVLLVLIAVITKKAGMADGIALICIGLLEGYQACMSIAVAGLVMIALCSGILLAIKKVDKNTEIPFIPFLTAGWMLITGVSYCG